MSDSDDSEVNQSNIDNAQPFVLDQVNQVNQSNIDNAQPFVLDQVNQVNFQQPTSAELLTALRNQLLVQTVIH